eukprot:3840423-Rhodomonas_salina.1
MTSDMPQDRKTLRQAIGNRSIEKEGSEATWLGGVDGGLLAEHGGEASEGLGAEDLVGGGGGVCAPFDARVL